MKTASKPVASVKSAEAEAEAEIDRLLGGRALFDIPDAQKFGGPSYFSGAARGHD
jgi:hypothetical protein